MSKTRKPVNYINGRELHEALVQWYDSRSNSREIPPKIVEGVSQICERLGTKANFRGYSYIEDMVSAAKLSCMMALLDKKYDPKKGENPFAYFTQIAYNDFRRIITEEKKHSYIKHKSLEHHMTAAMLAGEILETTVDDSGRVEDLVNKFEKSTAKEDLSISGTSDTPE